MDGNIIRVRSGGRCQLDDYHVARHHVVALLEVESTVVCVIFGCDAVRMEDVVFAELLHASRRRVDLARLRERVASIGASIGRRFHKCKNKYLEPPVRYR